MTTTARSDIPASPTETLLEIQGRHYVLCPVSESDIGSAVALISKSMNIEEGGYAAQTLHLHFASRNAGVDDGRVIFVLKDANRVVGIVGLHHYSWGPPENVWLSWFALDPDLRGRGIAPRLVEAVTEKACQRHFMKFFIETYSTPEFARARAFYESQGFTETGGIPSWLPDGGSMVVYYKDLSTCA